LFSVIYAYVVTTAFCVACDRNVRRFQCSPQRPPQNFRRASMIGVCLISWWQLSQRNFTVAPIEGVYRYEFTVREATWL
jgi:hypothetical protein